MPRVIRTSRDGAKTLVEVRRVLGNAYELGQILGRALGKDHG